MAEQIKIKEAIHISHQDLPFACPPPNMPQLAHPKVFLNFKEKVTTCPYCGTTYVIDDKVALSQVQ